MQFKTLASLLAEGPVHFLVTEVADGRIRVYVEPKPTKEQQGQKAASSPFSVCDTAENLDAGFDAALTEWIDSRGATLQDLAAGLAASKAQLASAAA